MTLAMTLALTCASIRMLFAGTALASTAPNAEATSVGVLLCLGSVACAAAWTVVSAILMQVRSLAISARIFIYH